MLAVDDEELILETYSIWLEDEYDLRTAGSGEVALEALDDDVDVVLLDRLMPGLSGDEVLDRIREREADARVALVTAVEPDFETVELPFDAYLTKALEREEVVDTIETLLDRAALDDVRREHHAVAEKLATLESRKSRTELETSETYQQLVTRLERLESELDDVDERDERRTDAAGDTEE